MDSLTSISCEKVAKLSQTVSQSISEQSYRTCFRKSIENSTPSSKANLPDCFLKRKSFPPENDRKQIPCELATFSLSLSWRGSHRFPGSAPHCLTDIRFPWQPKLPPADVTALPPEKTWKCSIKFSFAQNFTLLFRCMSALEVCQKIAIILKALSRPEGEWNFPKKGFPRGNGEVGWERKCLLN